MSRKTYTAPRWLYILMAVVGILIIARVALPGIAKNYINKTIDELPGYSGGVDEVDIHLLRGGMGLHGMTIYKDSLSRKFPLFKSEYMEFFLRWSALFRGDLIARGMLDKPELLVIAESTKEAKQETKEVGKDAKKVEKKEEITEKVPFRIDEIEIHNGKFAFKKLDTKPVIHIFLSNIEVTAENLTNSKKLSDSLIAKVKMQAKAMGHADFSLFLALNPWDKPYNFDVKSKLLHLQAKSLNAITKEYGKFDFEKGDIDLVTEVSVRKGLMNGYVKPLLSDIEIAGEKDKTRDKDNIFKRWWENLVGAAEEVVENQPISQSGTKIPIKGSLNDPEPKMWDAVVGVLRNAFVSALLPNYEHGDAKPPKTAH
jgi:hypothetical protein